MFDGLFSAATRGRDGSGGGSSAQIYHDTDGLQAHIEDTNDSVMALLQYHLPNSSGGHRRVLTGTSTGGRRPRADEGMSDGRSMYSSRQNFIAPSLRRPDAAHHTGMYQAGDVYQYPRGSRGDSFVSTPQPSLHPLLSVSDPRLARSLLPPTSPGARVMMHGLLSTGGPYSYGSGYSMTRQLDPDEVRIGIANRRQPLNPFVSDRRWGTDVGEIDLVGGRLQPLVDSFVDSMADTIIADKSTASTSTASTRAFSAETQRLRRSIGNWLLDRSTREDRIRGSHDDPHSREHGEEYFPSVLRIGPGTRRRSRPQMISADTNDAAAATATDSSGTGPSPTLSAPVDPGPAEGAEVAVSVSTDMEETEPSSSAPLSNTGSSAVRVEAALGPEGRECGGNSQQNEERPSWPVAASTAGDVSLGEGSVGDVLPLECPPGVDEDVWRSLPTEMQLELRESLGSGLMAETELDRDVLTALPAGVRAEVVIVMRVCSIYLCERHGALIENDENILLCNVSFCVIGAGGGGSG